MNRVLSGVGFGKPRHHSPFPCIRARSRCSIVFHGHASISCVSYWIYIREGDCFSVTHAPLPGFRAYAIPSASGALLTLVALAIAPVPEPPLPVEAQFGDGGRHKPRRSQVDGQLHSRVRSHPNSLCRTGGSRQCGPRLPAYGRPPCFDVTFSRRSYNFMVFISSAKYASFGLYLLIMTTLRPPCDLSTTNPTNSRVVRAGSGTIVKIDTALLAPSSSSHSPLPQSTDRGRTPPSPPSAPAGVADGSEARRLARSIESIPGADEIVPNSTGLNYFSMSFTTVQ